MTERPTQNAEKVEPNVSVSLTAQHATKGDLEALAGLVNRWTGVFDDEDKRLDRRIDWTQAEVRRVVWVVRSLMLLCAALTLSVIWLGWHA